MERRQQLRGAIAVAVALTLLTSVLTARHLHREGSVRTTARPAAVAAPAPSGSPAVPQVLVPWSGPVEHLFFHPLVGEASLAFTDDTLGRGFANYFVTTREFQGILDGLWRNGWTLVDCHRAAAGTVRVPPGRKPFVLSEDDVNYYDYFTGRGLPARLLLAADGSVMADVDGPSTADLVPMVDAEVRAHPEFSAEGAKGVLALTGYQGLFGEHDLTDASARARVRALVTRLRDTGWTMASHTFGHIRLARDSPRVIARDTARWLSVASDLLGPVDVLVYPFGSRPSAAGRRVLRDAGFLIQLDIDITPARYVVDGVTVMSRRHIDGLAFEQPRRLARFFDVATVRDPLRP